jgi:hypothetical protein
MATEKIFIGNGEEVIELTGQEKTEFIAMREQMQAEQAILEAEYKAKQDARASAINKLAEIAGLTQEELASIL